MTVPCSSAVLDSMTYIRCADSLIIYSHFIILRLWTMLVTALGRDPNIDSPAHSLA